MHRHSKYLEKYIFCFLTPFHDKFAVKNCSNQQVDTDDSAVHSLQSRQSAFLVVTQSVDFYGCCGRVEWYGSDHRDSKVTKFLICN